MAYETEAGPAAEVPAGSVRGAGRFAVGNREGGYFAVTRRCRHLLGDLGRGTLDDEGCLTCPWHGAKYDPDTGRMVRGPQGVFARIPGLGASVKALTRVLPLGRGVVTERDGDLFIRTRH